MIALAASVFCAALQSSPPPIPPITSYHLLNRDIPAIPPAYGLEEEATSKVQDWTYAIDRSGRVIDRQVGNSAGEELTQLYKERAKTPLVQWKVKIVLFTRCDILDHGKDGILRQRRSGFFNPDVDNALKSISLFGAMVDAYTGGNCQFVPEVVEDEQPMRFDTPTQLPFDASFAKSYFGPRLNYGAYTADDKVFRGPYQSVFFIHAGLSKAECDTDVNGTPISGLPFYYDFDAHRPAELARHLFNHWVGHLAFQSSRHGYHLVRPTVFPRDDFGTGAVRIRRPLRLITPAMWTSIANVKDTSDYSAHYPAGTTAVSKDWAEVEDDPWVKLPLLSPPAIPGLGDRLPVVEQVTDQGLVFACEPEYATFVQSQTPGSKVIGFTNSSAGPRVLISALTKRVQPPVSAFQTDKPAALSFKSGDPKLPLSGDFGYKLADDPQQGRVALVNEDWAARSGWLRLLGGNQDLSGLYLTILVKSVTAPFDITVVGEDGIVSYRLFQDTPPVSDGPDSYHTTFLDIKPTGEWQRVTIDLQRARKTSGVITGIYLTPGATDQWEAPTQNPPAIALADAAIAASGTPTPESTNVSFVIDNSQLAAQVTPANYNAWKSRVLPLLKSQDEQAQLNAAAVYTRVKDKAAEAALAELTKDIDPRVAEMAMEALAFQGTDTARGPILSALQLGPFESNKYYAAEVLGRQKDPELVSFYGDLIIGRDWQTRLAAANAIGAVPGERASTMLVAFLEETDPQILMRIAQMADTSQDLVAKRMQWYALNDPFDEVRAYCDLALIRSPIAGYPEEGLKGLHDDSWVTRRLILESFALHPDEKYRSSILATLSDSSSEVREAALDALAVLPKPINDSELAPVQKEKDPRVQLKIIDLSRRKNIKLSSETVDNLRKSVDLSVVEGTKGLP